MITFKQVMSRIWSIFVVDQDIEFEQRDIEQYIISNQPTSITDVEYLARRYDQRARRHQIIGPSIPY